MVLSSFSDKHHGEKCTIAWELWHDGLNGRVTDGMGEIVLPVFGYGTTAIGNLDVTMPCENAAPVLSLYLKAADGTVISRNFVAFDVQAALAGNMVEIPVCSGKTSGFAPVWNAIVDDKLCMGGCGEVSYEVALPASSGMIRDITLHMETASKRILKKDCKEIGDPQEDHGFMRGYLVDRGAFKNSYWMTDEEKMYSRLTVLVDGVEVAARMLTGDNADARGVLSWHYQPEERKLDEAGSYGEMIVVRVPSRLIPSIAQKGSLTLTLKADNGLALYGRNTGRYGMGLEVRAE